MQHQVEFESFGVPIRIVTNSAEAFARLGEVLPPGSNPRVSLSIDWEIGVVETASGIWELRQGERRPSFEVSLDQALIELQRQLRRRVALNASTAVFVHAGVVESGGRAIVMPGAPFAGKSTLVAALVRAGATYLSDEYAVFDERGRVHPFAKPLSLRDAAGIQHHHSVETLDGAIGTRPIAVGAVVFSEYRPGAGWDPRRMTTGQAVLAISKHALALRERPRATLRALTQALADAVAVSGARGEAVEVVAALFDLVRELPG